MSEDGDASMFSGGNNFGDLVDPNLDPELALVRDLSLFLSIMAVMFAPSVYTYDNICYHILQAIRISLEEDKARREQEAAKAAGQQEAESSTMAVDSGAIEEEQKLMSAALSASMETTVCDCISVCALTFVVAQLGRDYRIGFPGSGSQ